MTFSHVRICLLVVFLTFTKSLFADTWYVRSDGGTRYSTNATSGQCDGKADAAYSGSGINQHCAFNDYRYLWDDKTYGNRGWVIAGGDTVILDNTQPWRVGFDGATANEAWCFGGTGPYDCTNPTFPAGTPGQHTRILGRNFAACSKANGQPDPSKMTQIFGGHALNTALNLSGAQYVDIQCIEITRHSQCMVHGLPIYGTRCNSAYPVDDYDSNGIGTSSTTHDVLLQDMYIHGHVNSGIQGNIGGLFTANRVAIAFNGMSGWNFDDGSNDSNGVLKLSYVSIIASGCLEEYPAVHSFPALVCYDQESAGYGDGLGTQQNYGISVSIDHSTFAYNTQDGVDFGHVDSGSNSLRITNSLAYANMGGQFKWGGNFTDATFENNLVLGNCTRMSMPLPNTASDYNVYLSDFCRAGDGISFNFRDGGTLTFANNSIVNYAPTTFDAQCWDGSCPNSRFILANNVVRGYDDPANRDRGGQVGGPGLFYLPQFIGNFTRLNNIYYGIRGACLAGVQVNSTSESISGESCVDPQFVNEPAVFGAETDLDSYNFQLATSSPALGAGATVSGVTTDFTDAARSNPTSIGALEAGSQAVLEALPNWGATTSASRLLPAPVVPVATTVSLSASPVDSILDNTTITSTVLPASGGAIPQGTVTLFYISYPIATATLDGNGTATWVFPAFIEKLGITAAYSGSSKFLGSNSAILATSLNVALQ